MNVFNSIFRNQELQLWFYTVNHGIAFGGGFYENQVVVPLWMGVDKERNCVYIHPSQMRRIDSGQKFWIFIGTIPLTLLTLSQLYTHGFVAKASDSLQDKWIRLSAIVSLVERCFTFSFFIPTAIRLMSVDHSAHMYEKNNIAKKFQIDKSDDKAVIFEKSIQHMARCWMNLNYLRLALSGVSWLAAMKGLSVASYSN